jgi:hypothetical protein
VSSAHPPPPGGREPGYAPQPGYRPADATVPGGPAYGQPEPPRYGGPQEAGAGYAGPVPGGPGPQHAGHGDAGGAHAAPAHAAPATGTDPGAGHTDVGEVSLGSLIGDVTRDLSTLMRQELALAQAEIKQEVAKTAKGAGALSGAGVAGYFVLLFLSIALWSALSNLMDAGWAGLIVALLWGVIGAVLFVVGRGQLRQVHPKPERTVDTLSQVPEALRGRSGTHDRGGPQ